MQWRDTDRTIAAMNCHRKQQPVNETSQSYSCTPLDGTEPMNGTIEQIASVIAMCLLKAVLQPLDSAFGSEIDWLQFDTFIGANSVPRDFLNALTWDIEHNADRRLHELFDLHDGRVMLFVNDDHLAKEKALGDNDADGGSTWRADVDAKSRIDQAAFERLYAALAAPLGASTLVLSKDDVVDDWLDQARNHLVKSLMTSALNAIGTQQMPSL